MRRVKALTAKEEKADPKRVGFFCGYIVIVLKKTLISGNVDNGKYTTFPVDG